VTILYFAWVRQKLGCHEETVDLPADVRTLAELAAHLQRRGDGFAEAFSDLKRLRAAVNQEHVGWETPVGADDEVAFFPPVTGG
jgi:molybdopterin synthase sulfur carrier subunit